MTHREFDRKFDCDGELIEQKELCTRTTKVLNQFHQLTNRTSFIGLGPGSVRFQGDLATVSFRAANGSNTSYTVQGLARKNQSVVC